MRNRKRFLSLVLSLALSVTMIPAGSLGTVHAETKEGQEIVTQNNGTAISPVITPSVVKVSEFDGSGNQDNTDGTVVIATGTKKVTSGSDTTAAYIEGETGTIPSDNDGSVFGSARVGCLKFQLPEVGADRMIDSAQVKINLNKSNNLNNATTKLGLYEVTADPTKVVVTNPSTYPAKNNDYSAKATVYSNEWVTKDNLDVEKNQTGKYLDLTFNVTDFVKNAYTSGTGYGVFRLQTVVSGVWVHDKDSANAPTLTVNTISAQDGVNADAAALELPERTESDLELPLTGLRGTTITWTSNKEEIISTEGKVTQQNTDEEVTLTANVAYGEVHAERSFNVTVEHKKSDSEIANEIAESLNILNADNITGNITLPTTDVEGATIIWESEDPTVISDQEVANEGYDSTPAGVVHRGSEDKVVKMTAKVSYGTGGNAQKDFSLTVKKAVAEPTYAGYLFTFFPSNDDERIYFSTSKDGLNFQDLNDETYIMQSNVGTKGVRDPYLIRSQEGDKFWLIATDLSIGTSDQSVDWGDAQYKGSLSLVVWESTDLVNWSAPRLVDTGIRNVGCVWAPEAIYDEKTGEYVVHWASMTGAQGAEGTHQVVYYAKTRDFVTFTQPQEYINIPDKHCIDVSMVKAGNSYYRVSAGAGREITIEKSDSVLGNWEQISDLKSLSSGMEGYDAFHEETDITLTGGVVEGPELFKFNNEDKWGLYTDNYGGVGYIPVTTTDLSDTTGAKWKVYQSSDYNFGSLKKRHGSITPITQAEYDGLMKKWGSEGEENKEEEQQTPILEYNFDETLSGSTIADVSGKEHAGTLYGNATYVADEEKGQVLYLNGTSGTYAEFPEGLFDGRNKMTISMDIKAVAPSSSGYFTFTFGKSDQKYMFLKTEDKYTRFSMTKEGYKNEETVSFTTDSIKGKWVNFKIVVNNSVVSLYVDHVLVSRQKNVAIRTSDLGKNLRGYLGKSFYSADAYFNGYFDNVKVYNRALTESEIAAEAGLEVTLLKGLTSKDVNIIKSDINEETGKVTLYASNYAYDLASMTSKKADLSKVALEFDVTDGAEVTGVTGTSDLTKDVTATVSIGEKSKTYIISTVVCNNPVVGGEFADPDIDAFNGKYYLYCTTDGFAGWGGYEFHVFSSEDLLNWKDEGIILNLKTDVKWSDGNAWAPSIEQKNGKYYFYFCGNDISNNKKAIGVAVADSPTGPFVAEEKPLITMDLCDREGIEMGQCIDPSIYTEEDGTSYMLFGNGKAAIVELGEDMVSTVAGTMHNYSGATDFREAITVNKFDGKYHFTWSCDDTGSENYRVNYGVSDTLYGDITYKYSLLVKDNANNIKGTGHHSILQVPGTSDFYIAYHRFLTPLGQVSSGFGYHRETCIDKLVYDQTAGLFEVGKATLEGVKAQTYTAPAKHKVVYQASEGGFIQGLANQVVVSGYGSTPVKAVPMAGYKFVKWSDGVTDRERRESAANITKDLTLTAEFAKLTKEEAAVYKDHLLAYLSFDSEEKGLEAAGGKGTVNGTIAFTKDALHHQALSLTGEGYIDLKKADGSSLLAGKDEITISYYSKVNGNNSNWAVFAAPNAERQTYKYEKYLGIMDKVASMTVQRYNNNGERVPAIEISENNSSWKHVVIVVEKNQTTLYVDGLKKQTIASDIALKDIIGENGVFQIGKGNWEDGEYMTGLLDEFKVYDCALSQAQVAAEGIGIVTDSSTEEPPKEDLKELVAAAERAFANTKVTTSLSIYKGKTGQIKVTYPGDLEAKLKAARLSIKNISYTSKEPLIAKVEQTGKVSALKIGKTSISTKITLSNGTNKILQTQITVQEDPKETLAKLVAAAEKAFTSTKVTTSLSIYKGKTKQVKITYPKGFDAKLKSAKLSIKSVSYNSSKPSIAKVDKKGKVSALKEGSTNITTKITLSNKKVKTLKTKVTVKLTAVQTAEKTFTTTKATKTLTVYKGKTGQIKIQYPKNLTAQLKKAKLSIKSVSYKPSKSSIVKVSKKGKVTGVKKGTANVTIKITLSNGKKKTLTTKVNVKNPYLTISGKSKVKVGKSITLKVKKYGVSGGVKWSVSDKKKASISSKGKLKAKKTGTVKVTVKVGKVSKTKKITITK